VSRAHARSYEERKPHLRNLRSSFRPPAKKPFTQPHCSEGEHDRDREQLQRIAIATKLDFL